MARLVTADVLWRSLLDGTWLPLVGDIWLHLAAAAAATGELKGLWESHLTLGDILHLSK